jgi:hypothetical protein
MEERYARIKSLILERGCELITRIDYFDETVNILTSKSKLDIIAKCGHESKIQYDMFKCKGSGQYCKICANKNASEKLKGKPQNSIEYDSFVIFKDLICDKFEVIKMCEGTLADVAIRPIGNLHDKYLPIQLKSTKQPNSINSNNYVFRNMNKYAGMLVFCVCIEDKRMWLIEGNKLNNINLTIGNKSSLYSSYEISDNNNLHNPLLSFYRTYVLQSFDTINTPISKQVVNEHIYRRKREINLHYLRFEYPEKEGQVFDFTVNTYKVQEKVASIMRRRGKIRDGAYIINLTRNNKENCSYKLGDNDFYWFVIPNSDMFYLIPEVKLHDNGYIGNINCIHKMITLYPTKSCDNTKILSSWMNKYLYDYNKVTPETILTILSSNV